MILARRLFATGRDDAVHGREPARLEPSAGPTGEGEIALGAGEAVQEGRAPGRGHIVARHGGQLDLLRSRRKREQRPQDRVQRRLMEGVGQIGPGLAGQARDKTFGGGVKMRDQGFDAARREGRGQHAALTAPFVAFGQQHAGAGEGSDRSDGRQWPPIVGHVGLNHLPDGGRIADQHAVHPQHPSPAGELVEGYLRPVAERIAQRLDHQPRCRKLIRMHIGRGRNNRSGRGVHGDSGVAVMSPGVLAAGMLRRSENEVTRASLWLRQRP